MKVSKPKPLVELLKTELTPENFPLMNQYKVIDEKGRYLHWDKFKRIYTKNTDFAWLATKLSRNALLNHFSIEQYDFSYAVPTTLQALLHFIDKTAGGNSGANNLTGLSQSEQNRFLLKSLIMEEAITSAQLEGAVTTRKVAKEMLEKARKPSNKDEMMIANNYHLMKEAPAKYARAYLYTETDDLDLTYFLYYQAEIIQRAITDLEKYISDKQNNFKAFSSAIAQFTTSVTPKLNDRQVQLLQKASKETGAIFTAKEISREYDITENTARKDLKRLADLNLFGQLKSGNQIGYITPSDLLARLKK